MTIVVELEDGGGCCRACSDRSRASLGSSMATDLCAPDGGLLRARGQYRVHNQWCPRRREGGFAGRERLRLLGLGLWLTRRGGLLLYLAGWLLTRTMIR